MNRCHRVMDALDQRHRQDPRTLTTTEGQTLPKEFWHAQQMSAWLDRLTSTPSEALQIAVRGQHTERWVEPRDAYPAGREGYLKWRRDQGIRAADITAELAEEAGYDAQEVERIRQLVRKQGFRHDPEAQTVEDCACLVFLENYFADFSETVDRDHMIRIVRKTWGKMSDQARELALTLQLPENARQLVDAALSADS